MNNLKKLKQINSEGFTLLEVVISLAIATFIIGGIVMFSVNSLKANMKSQAMQETMDNARFAIDDLAKKVRTSSNVVVTDGGGALFFVDNLTSTKYCYQFGVDGSGNKIMKMKAFELKVGESGNITNGIMYKEDYNNVTNCSGDKWTMSNIGGGPEISLIGNSKTAINGKFEVLKTDTRSDDPHRGFVRVNIDIVYKKGLDSGDPTDSAEAHIQTGVSILDYTRENGVLDN